MTFACLKQGCSVTWEADPMLAVACPTCHAPAGSRCVRPSGHRVWRGFFHAERDILADKEGHYGVCPTGRCGAANKEAAQAPAQLAFDDILDRE